jgi:hypothetical protein
MPDRDHQHAKLAILQLANDAVIPYPVAPQFAVTAFQGLADTAEFVQRGYSLS